ncbi:MAG TPA: hypothetical protein VIG33_14665 [Pseudobdellovibrionaceae bacterium]|jgi:hypothetical protein
MKTKTITLERFISINEVTGETWDVYRHDKDYRLDAGWKLIPCKVTFEVPLPEPSVSITPSRLEEIHDEWIGTVTNMKFSTYLKHKLFPDWEG